MTCICGELLPPAGEQLAVLHVDGGAGPAARLSLIDLATGERRDVEGGFDYLSRIAWSPAADRLALVQRLEGGDPSRGFALLEVDAAKLSVARLHTFETALEVAPLGYRPDGALLVAVVDDGGSTVWAYSEGEATAGPRFSSGLTSDWSLSPDGDRLAFVEHLGVAQRNRGGRVLTIATGRITAAGSAGEHTGAVWRPGSPVPDFGGPGGTVVLSDPEPGSYLVPMSWTPDGRYLVAAVFQPAVDGEEPRSIIEIMSPGRRMHLSPVDGARFLGLAAVD
jgi:Tol biopolymer transport system component